MKLPTTTMSSLLVALSAVGIVAAQTPEQTDIPKPAGAKAKYEEITVENGGVIRGRVTFHGEPPKLTLAVNQDRAHCTHDESGMRPSPRLTVGPDGGVAQAVVYLKEIARGKPLADLKVPARLDQKDCTYEPFVQVVPFKAKLTIANSDPLNHNIHAKLDERSLFNFAQPNVGEMTKSVTWPGVISMNCDVHMWMNAYIFSVRHPYYAVTDAAGAYELTHVPPGEYELVAWHAGWNAQPVVNPDGQTTGYKYDPPVVRTAKITVAAGATATAEFVIND